MKKITAIFALSVCAASASYLDAYEKGDYALALDEALKVCARDCDDVQLNLFIARTAEQLGNMHEALAAYDRVLIFDENNIEAHFAMARIYAQQGNRALLEAELSALESNPSLSPSAKEQLERLRQAKLDENAQNKPWRLSLGLGFGYDSNPKRDNDSLKDEIDEPIDSAFSSRASIDAAYDIDINELSSIALEAGFEHRNYFKPRAQKYPNMDAFSASIRPRFALGDASQISFGLNYDFLVYKGHADSHTISIDADIYHDFAESLYLSSGYSYARSFYIKDIDKDDDFVHQSAYASVGKDFVDFTLAVALSYDKERAKDSFDPNSDYYSYAFALFASAKLDEKFSLESSLGYSRTFYAKFDDYEYFNKRRDKDLDLSTALNYSIDEHNLLSFGVNFGRTYSNQDENSARNFGVKIDYRYQF